jgi:hypothetical protein
MHLSFFFQMPLRTNGARSHHWDLAKQGTVFFKLGAARFAAAV